MLLFKKADRHTQGAGSITKKLKPTSFQGNLGVIFIKRKSCVLESGLYLLSLTPEGVHAKVCTTQKHNLVQFTCKHLKLLLPCAPVMRLCVKTAAAYPH